MTRTTPIADGGTGLRASQKAAMSEIPAHSDVSHIQQQSEKVANCLIRRVQGRLTRPLVNLSRGIASPTRLRLTIDRKADERVGVSVNTVRKVRALQHYWPDERI